MRVLYIISSHGSGRGGHYHSLDHISRAMSERIDAKVVSIGGKESPVISNNPLFHTHLHYGWSSVGRLNNEFKKIISEFNPNIVHCFDNGSHLVAQVIPALSRRRLVLNRCGGPNHGTQFCPVSDNLVVFSSENYEWFRQNKRFKKSTIRLIPHRVGPIQVLSEDVRPFIKKEDEFTFVKIGRLDRRYEEGIHQSLELIRRLGTKHKVRLYIIGSVDDEKVLESAMEVVDHAGLPATFITDEAYTRQASRMLYLADASIATGRGVMEAMSLGIPVLSPVSEGGIPALVDENTFQRLYENNFSGRSTIEDTVMANMTSKISSMVSSNDEQDRLSTFSRHIFKSHFDVATGVDKYIDLYRQVMNRKARPLLWKNSIHIIQYLMRVRKWQGKTKI